MPAVWFSLETVSDTTVAISSDSYLILAMCAQSTNFITFNNSDFKIVMSGKLALQYLQCIQLESISMCLQHTYFKSSTELFSCSASARAMAPVEVTPHRQRLQWEMLMTHFRSRDNYKHSCLFICLLCFF